MTTYNVTTIGVTDGAILAGSYEVRLVAITAYNSSIYNSVYVTVARHEPATISGGTAVPITPLRQGAPAASATAKQGTGLTVSGTSKTLQIFALNAASLVEIGAGVQTVTVASANFQPALATTIAPGSALHVSGMVDGYCICNIFFEELRLAGSY